jgi:hypothetical protein
VIVTAWCAGCERRPAVREGGVCQPCRVEIDVASPTKDKRTGLVRPG